MAVITLRLCSWACFAVLLILFSKPPPSFARKRADNATVKPIVFVNDQRLLNWCVTGDDEEEFNYYPYSDFIPYFKKTQADLVRKKDQNKKEKYDYHFELTAPRYRDDSAVKGELRNTGHLKFKSFVLRESSLGIKEVLKPKKIEGLAIQVNWAPNGIGLPANFAFVNQDTDIICFDCHAASGIPVGCRRRPANAIIHPTILVYHYKMATSKAREERLQDFERVMEKNENATIERNKIRQEKLNQQSGNKTTVTTNTVTTNTTNTNTTAPPDPCADPTARHKPECMRAQFELADLSETTGVTDEVHGTLHWFMPPCSTTRGIEFQVLVIHNFAQQEYEVFKVGPYEIPHDIANTIMVKKHNQFIPSPFFHGFTELMECDSDQNSVLLTINDYSDKFRHPFDYSHSFEKCMNDEEGYKPKDGGQVCEKPSATKCDQSTSKFLDQVNTKCSQVHCEATATATRKPPEPITKRGIHGGINMVTNFCLQSIFIFIGRYYKETFNLYEFKGAKLWFWIHMLGGGAASICQYVGYFHPKYVHGSYHVYAGNTLMVMLGIVVSRGFPYPF